MTIRRRPFVAFLLALMAAGSDSAARPRPSASFRRLGDLPGGIYHSLPTAVSDDGQVVVGYSSLNRDGVGDRAFRWTATGGMETLPHLRGGDRTYAADVSADGQVIVGQGSFGDRSGSQRALRWSRALGTVALGTDPGPGGVVRSGAYGVSPDGHVIVGSSVNEFGGDQAFRWTDAEGMELLPYIARGAMLAYAHDVSSDGNMIVGMSDAPDPVSPGAHVPHAFWWTRTTGTRDIDFNGARSSAQAVSPDGRFVAGGLYVGLGFVWSPPQLMMRLPALRVRRPHDPSSTASAISADGKRVVGSSLVRIVMKDGVPMQVRRAVMWDRDRRIHDLKRVLSKHRVKLGRWDLTEATAISSDGRTVVGFGTSPSGDTEGWLITLPAPR